MNFFMPYGAAPVPAWRSEADDQAFRDQVAKSYGPGFYFPPVPHNSGNPEFPHIYPYPMYVYPAPFYNVYEQDEDGGKKFRHAPYYFVPGGSVGYPGFVPVPMVRPEENEEDVNDQKQMDSRFQHPRFVAMPAINGDPLAALIQQGAHPLKYPHFVTYPDDGHRRDGDDDDKSGFQCPLVFMPASDGKKKERDGFQQPAYFVPSPMFDGRALQPQKLNENKGSKMQSQRPQSVPGMCFPADNKEQYLFPYFFPSMDPSSCYQLYGPPYMKGIKPVSPQVEVKPLVHRDEDSQDQNLWMNPQKPMFCLPSSSGNDVSSSKEKQKPEKQKSVPVLDPLGNLNALRLPSNDGGQEKIKDVSLDSEPSSQAAIRVIPVRPVKEENLSKQMLPKAASQDKQVKDTKKQIPALNDVKSEVGSKQTQSALPREDSKVHNSRHSEVKPDVNKQVNAKGKQGFPPLKLVVDDCKKGLKGSPSSFSSKDQGHAKPKINAEERMQGTKALDTKTRKDEVSAQSNQMAIEEIGQRLKDIDIKTARKDEESLQSCKVKLWGSKDIDGASKCDKSGESKKVKGAHQESDNNGKDVDLTGLKTFLDETAAATYIQSRVRGFLVRKSQPLTCLKNVAMVKSKLEHLKSQVPTDGDLDKVCSDPKECVKLSETIMALLLQLDIVQGVHPVVRDIRKSVSKELLKIQDYVDNEINRVSNSVNQAVPAAGNCEVLMVEKADKNVSPGPENQGQPGILLDQVSQVSCPSIVFKDIQKQEKPKKDSMSPDDLGIGEEGGQQEKQSDSSMYLLKLDENGQMNGVKAARLQEIDEEKSLLKSGENIENIEDSAKLEHSLISCPREGIHDVVKDELCVILPETVVKNEVEVAGSIVKEKGRRVEEISSSVYFALGEWQEKAEQACTSELSDSAKVTQGVSLMDIESKLVEDISHDQSRQTGQVLNEEQEMKKDREFHLSPMLADVQSQEEGKGQHERSISMNFAETERQEITEQGRISELSDSAEASQGVSLVDTESKLVEGMPHDQSRRDQQGEQDLNKEQEMKQDQCIEQDLNKEQEMKQDQRSEQDLAEEQEMKQDLTQQFHFASMLADVQSEEKDQRILMEGIQEMAMDKNAEVESTLKMGKPEEGQESTSDISCHGHVVQECCSKFHVGTDVLSAIDENKQEEFSRKTLAKELEVRHLEVNNEGAHSHEFNDFEEVARVLDSSKHHHMTELETIQQGQLEEQHCGTSNGGIERHQYFSKQDASILEKVAECEQGHKNWINEVLPCRDVSSGCSIDNQNAYSSSTLPVQVNVCRGGFDKVSKTCAALLGSMGIESPVQHQDEHNDLDGGSQRDIDIPKVGSPLGTDLQHATSAWENPSICFNGFGSGVHKRPDHVAEVHETSDHAADKNLGCLDHPDVALSIPRDVEDASGQKSIVNNNLYLLLEENRQLNSMVREMVQYAQSQAASLVHLQQRMDCLEKRILRRNLRRSKLKFRA